VSAEDAYLDIPVSYASALGGLRWSSAGDAIEDGQERTFAVGAEVAELFQGLLASRRVLHFAFVLHLLQLLKRGSACGAHAQELRDTFVRAGKNLANAGAFFGAVLDVPGVAFAVDPNIVLVKLRGSPGRLVLGARLARAIAREAWVVEEAPLTPEQLETRVLRALGEHARSLEHWLRTGRAPVEGERLAETIAREHPLSLEATLARALGTERLAGASPFVAPLVSALALPRRRLESPELPLGGYADVTTRGGFDQVLPSQLVLDELEFVRRFAANELLYYRREEPHKDRHEELVLLVDQGARTWGFVRLVLAAGVVAFGKLAARRKLPVFIATTGNGARLVDMRAVTAGDLATLLEASDLALNPGLALESVLEQPAPEGRDVILLTQTRNVTHPDVLAAARRVGKGVRIFAAGVAEDGAVALSELRHGAPVVRSQCRVEVRTPAAEKPTDKIVCRAVIAPAKWQGDVEPIPFPFRFGLAGRGSPCLFDFDRTGEWILVANRLGVLHAARTDGSRFEIVPRTDVGWQPTPLTRIERIFGTSDGFVVVGHGAGIETLAHYDFQRRIVKRFPLDAPTADATWLHLPELRTLVRRGSDECLAIDLDQGDRSSRAERARSIGLAGGGGDEPRLRIVTRDHPSKDSQPSIELTPEGTLRLHGIDSPWDTATPLAEGKNALAGRRIIEARFQGGMLAASFFEPGAPGVTLRLFGPPDGRCLAIHEHASERGFALSADGTCLARETAASRVEVRQTGDAFQAFALPVGRFHNDVDVLLEPGALHIHFARFRHTVRWTTGALLSTVDTAWKGAPRLQPAQLPRLAAYDKERFVKAFGGKGDLVAVVDVFGQVALLDREGKKLIAMFFAYRNQLAGWMPDGTRWGSGTLLDGPPTPDSASKIAQALQEATR
jgi:hypothetical protein